MKREKVITCDPEILGGTSVFTDTRVPVQTLIDYLKGGDSLEDFLDGFPQRAPSASRSTPADRNGVGIDTEHCACCLTKM